MDGFPNDERSRTDSAPYVVVFFQDGEALRARIRDVASQKQWILSDARALRALLIGPTY